MSTVTFSELEYTLSLAGSETRAAACQATLSGLICAHGPLPEDWVNQVSGGVADDRPTAELTDRLYHELRADLSEGQMEFDLLLPGDDVSLVERTEALAEWCQGFLYGLTMGGIPANKALPGEVAEIVSDFSTLAQAQHDGDALEEDESAYAELYEYVRVAVQLVYEELAVTTQSSSNR